MMLFPDLLFVALALFGILWGRYRGDWGWRRYGAAFGVWFLFNQGVARAVVIPSESMAPTLQVGDRLIVDVLGYQLEGPRRGDVLAFRSPEGPKVLCKRLIALPGEVIAVRSGWVSINGRRLPGEERRERSLQDFGPYRVAPGHLFMMGDHRNNSYDSRFFGPVAEDLVIGRMPWIWWPLSRLGAVH